MQTLLKSAPSPYLSSLKSEGEEHFGQNYGPIFIFRASSWPPRTLRARAGRQGPVPVLGLCPHAAPPERWKTEIGAGN